MADEEDRDSRARVAYEMAIWIMQVEGKDTPTRKEFLTCVAQCVKALVGNTNAVA